MAFRNKQGQVIVRSNRTLQRYVITDQLGSGGFGEVYRARMIDLKISVALKRFRSKIGFAQKTLDTWFSEYSTHEALSHPNILQAYDAFEDGGFFYLATELATNSIDHYIDDRSSPFLPWNDGGIARAGMHIASALHYLHVGWRPSRPLIHRDVTPNNVFLFEDSNVFKLGDFGISKLLDDPEDRASTQVGNYAFVAPELIRLNYTVPQSDLFQLGLVLYTMAAGAYLVPSSAPIKIKIDTIALGGAYQAADQLNDIDEQLKNVIKRLLLRDLSKRYPTAEAVHADLLRTYHRLRTES